MLSIAAYRSANKWTHGDLIYRDLRSNLGEEQSKSKGVTEPSGQDDASPVKAATIQKAPLSESKVFQSQQIVNTTSQATNATAGPKVFLRKKFH